jgi:hypothetical protein
MCPIFFLGLNKHAFFLVIFEEKSPIKIFLKNLSSGSLVIPCRSTGKWTDITELLVTSQNFANAPKTEYVSHIKHTVSPFQVVQFNVV